MTTTATFAQYCRIESIAGGASASPRAIVRAAWTLLSENGRTPAMRHHRHAWLRQVLAYHRHYHALAESLGAPETR